MAKAKASGAVTFGSTQIVYGITAKPNTGSIQVNFSDYQGTEFDSQPAVTVTPFWEYQDTQVGYVETLIEVDTNYFTVTSPNFGSDYRICWIAIGKLSST